MSASDDDETPAAELCNHLCHQFAEITGSDTALGHFYLQDVQWNLEAAVNNYYAAGGDAAGSSVAQLEPAIKSAPETAIRPKQPEVDNSIMKLLSWNIDGLDKQGLSLRTRAACTIIIKEKPTAVFLQEVVPESLSIISDYLNEQYWILRGKQPLASEAKKSTAVEFPYFTAMLLDRSAVELNDPPELIPFSGTSMGRNLLKLQVDILGTPCLLMTTHLESTKDMADERVKQLKRCFENLTATSTAHLTTFFGGDLNLRDKELQLAGGIPSGVEDLWALCGSSKHCQYTWDCRINDNLQGFEKFKPKARFDRLYMKQLSEHPKWQAKDFRLVGTERIQTYGRFASDHWGILCTLKKN